MNRRAEAPDRRQLAGLVFELASQLHVERAQRVALQAALERSGVLEPSAIAAVAAEAAARQLSRQMLEESIARLLRVLTEDIDPRHPLRDARAGRKTRGTQS